jgi:adenosine deaminase
MRVTGCTEDLCVFGIDLSHEYGILSSKLKFSPADLITVAFQGVDALFLPEAQKTELKARFETELTGILGRLGKGGRRAAGR